LQDWVYLAVVIDLYSRRVLGWHLDRRMETALVSRALMMAINLRNPPRVCCITLTGAVSTRVMPAKRC